LRVVVTGATGNVGTSVVPALLRHPDVTEVVAVARRLGGLPPTPRVRAVALDIGVDDLRPVVAGADAVVHLAWQIQPARDLDATTRANVVGSERVFGAAVEAGAAIVHLSSIGAYSPGPKGPLVTEDHPTHGVESLFYSRQKAYVERLLDLVEASSPSTRAVRFRPVPIVKRASAARLRRMFFGPFLPNPLVGRLPVAPRIPGLRLQLVHTDDVADAIVTAVTSADARGAYNLAADPVLEPSDLAAALGGIGVPVPRRALRAGAAAAYALRLDPTPPGWIDVALRSPLISVARARDQLGWRPRHSATDALAEILAALRRGDDGPTPPLANATGGPVRATEIATGLGATDAAPYTYTPPPSKDGGG